ncbi:PAS domain-containing protein [Klebsiella quasipneumoniae subsp. similipneumoniae]|nr:PAS domain-containing protein [Klebsiella quasipneumoniae subsp. similipneumoniae]
MTSEYTQQVAQIAGPLEAAMDAMAGTLSANQEVVLHNLTTPEHSIIKIINGHVSGRGNGDHLLAGPEKDTGFALLLQKTNNNKPRTISDYKTVTASGKTLNSASTIYYSEEGYPLIAFCINVDPSPFEQIRKSLDALLPSPAEAAEAVDLNLGGLIDQSIQEIIDKYSVPGKKIQKAQRLKIVAEMHTKGIFKMRGGRAAGGSGPGGNTIYGL